MLLRKTYYLLWFATIVVAFLIRSGAGCYWQSQLDGSHDFGAFEGDSHAYWVLGLQIFKGQPYHYGDETAQVFRTPGYPIMLAALFRPLGKRVPVLMARHLNALLGTVTVVLVGSLAGQLFGARVALIAAIFAALHPLSVVMSSLVLTEAPFCPWMLLQLICWLRAVKSPLQRPRIAWSVMGGLSAGIAVLIRPSWLLFTPFSLLVALIAASEKKRQLAIGGLMMVSTVLVLMPWWVRNYRVTGQFVATTLQVGTSLYDGLNPQATGASDMQLGKDRIASIEQAESEAAGPPVGTIESRRDHRLRQESLAWARHHPGRVLQLAVIKFLRMWNVWPNADQGSSLLMRMVLLVSYLPLITLAGCGLWQQRRGGWGIWLCVLPAVYFTLLHVIFVSSLRYRQPAVLTLLVLAAAALGSWFLDKEVPDEQICSATS